MSVESATVLPSGSARGKVRVKTKAMAIRGDISGVTAPAHTRIVTRIWFAMYAGRCWERIIRQEDSPDAGCAASCENH